MSDEQELKIWWDSNGLDASAYQRLVQELEITSLEDLVVLPNEDIAECAQELGLKFGKKAKFMKAVSSLKQSYNKKKQISRSDKKPNKTQEDIKEQSNVVQQQSTGGFGGFFGDNNNGGGLGAIFGSRGLQQAMIGGGMFGGVYNIYLKHLLHAFDSENGTTPRAR
eukprot:208414_1